MPPPGKVSERVASTSRRGERISGIKGVKPGMSAATVDEVTADMSKDPRRERDDDEPSDEETKEDEPNEDET